MNSHARYQAGTLREWILWTCWDAESAGRTTTPRPSILHGTNIEHLANHVLSTEWIARSLLSDARLGLWNRASLQIKNHSFLWYPWKYFDDSSFLYRRYPWTHSPQHHVTQVQLSKVLKSQNLEIEFFSCREDKGHKVTKRSRLVVHGVGPCRRIISHSRLDDGPEPCTASGGVADPCIVWSALSGERTGRGARPCRTASSGENGESARA